MFEVEVEVVEEGEEEEEDVYNVMFRWIGWLMRSF